MVSIEIDRGVLAQAEQYLTGVRRDLRLPGLAIAIIQGTEVVFLYGLGEAAPSRPVTPQTPFILGSLSKSFTAMAIMQLVETGKVELDAPVQHYISWFRVANPAACSQITIRHLLTHTSGISKYVGRELLAGKGNQTMEQQVRHLATVALTKPVGTTFQYSNTNYLILGLVIQMVSGQPYEFYIQQHIFAPLQMQHSFTSEKEAQQDGMATGYRWWFGFPIPAHVSYLADALPAAFLISSAEDMAGYLIAYLNEGRYGEASVLSAAGIAELHRPQVEIAPGNAYAMGWRVELWDGVRVLRHGGETANWRAEMVLLPEKSRLGIIVLTNANNGLVAQLGLDQIAAGVVKLLLGQQLQRSKLTLRRFYLLLDGAMALLTSLQIWAFVRLLRRWHQPIQGRALPFVNQAVLSLIALVLPLSLLKRIPKWADAPWSLLSLYVPDLSSWLAGISLLSFITGIMRIGRIFLRLRKGLK